ncbi:MAG: hypothetical protein AMXMBFR84_05080 [Candidatus Hydrogenedentota bacterium]
MLFVLASIFNFPLLPYDWANVIFNFLTGGFDAAILFFRALGLPVV